MEQTPHPASEQIKPTGCCPPFDPEPWQEKEITWTNKLFVKDHYVSFSHMPLNMGGSTSISVKAYLLAFKIGC